jgi:hypothetical protein
LEPGAPMAGEARVMRFPTGTSHLDPADPDVVATEISLGTKFEINRDGALYFRFSVMVAARPNRQRTGGRKDSNALNPGPLPGIWAFQKATSDLVVKLCPEGKARWSLEQVRGAVGPLRDSERHGVKGPTP